MASRSRASTYRQDRRAPLGRRVVAALRLGVALSGLLALISMPLPLGIDPHSHTAAHAGSPLAAGVAPVSGGAAQPAPPPAPPPTPVSVAIDTLQPRTPVPYGFLGLSFEMSALGELAGDGARGDLVNLLRSLGPGVLRLGGVSADTQAAWTDAATPLPSWASVAVTDRELRELATLAARSGWRVLFTLGLAHFEPIPAAREAAAAKAALGKWLAAFEIGNEPDAYVENGLRTEPWTFAQYYPEALAYRQAIAHHAPGVALAGPDVSGSHAFPRWGPPESADLTPGLLTGHHYPLGCHKLPAPSIEGLLSPETRYKEQLSLGRYMTVAVSRRTPFRMTEANTVSCGGTAGISNTFASALWAVDYTARAMTTGLAGLNFQGAPANCSGYSPLCASTPARLSRGELHAQPEWYALLMTRSLVGDRPLHTVIESSGSSNVDVQSLLAPTGALEVVLVDDDPPGSASDSVSLRPNRRFGAASLLSLTAPSPQSTDGVRLGGREVQPDGSWREPAKLPSVPDRNGAVIVTLAPSSAVLVRVAPAPPTRRAAHRRH
ncbi:MAG TPA: hypothetical protein VEJ23_10385 [Solirubrobacteraceae bacterium]|nr:hypothetical protein [Solirubrobacteraceae bacterium]